MLEAVLPHTTRSFARALVMPNLKQPITLPEQMVRYREEILQKSSGDFEPLMTLMLTHETTPLIVQNAKRAGVIAFKYYPKGLTTNSEHGVENILELADTLRALEDEGIVLCLHGEQCGAFCLDREEWFLQTLIDLVTAYPKLRIVLEHISTAAAIVCVSALPDTVAATITVHHLLLTLDDVIGGPFRPHYFFKPIPKRESDRAALIGAATSGNPKFFLGTDSAPHSIQFKENDCGCAGVFTAPVAMEVLIELFIQHSALAKLKGFTSENGAWFYGLPLNQEIATYKQIFSIVPEVYYARGCASGYPISDNHLHSDYLGIRPFKAGESLHWQLVSND